jgi:Na+/phosphate symporter
MALKFLRGGDGERLERVERKVQLMVQHDRTEFELAMKALLGDVVAASVNDELRSTDRKVNELEREIRRELLVHASVLGAINTPAILIYMSVVKDVERIGDYAKNLVDLALDGASFAATADNAEWRSLTADITRLIAAVGEAFRSHDSARSKELLSEGNRLLKLFDSRVSALVRGEDTGEQGVARALAHRYLKRIVAHLMNILSAVVMPLDRLDYFDEDPEDRI